MDSAGATAHRQLVVTPRPRPQRRLGSSAAGGGFCVEAARPGLWGSRVEKAPLCRLLLLPRPSCPWRGRRPVPAPPGPPVRIGHAATPAGEHTCGPAPAPFVSWFFKCTRETTSVSGWRRAGADSCAPSRGSRRSGAASHPRRPATPGAPWSRCPGESGGKRARSASESAGKSSEGGHSGGGGENNEPTFTRSLEPGSPT